MRKFLNISVYLLMIVLTGTFSANAQIEGVIINLPIQGRYAFVSSTPFSTVDAPHGLFLLDTVTGVVENIGGPYATFENPRWSLTGDLLTYRQDFIAYSVINPATGIRTQQLTFPERQGSFSPQIWLSNNEILYRNYDFSTRTYALDLYNTATSNLTNILSFSVGQELVDILPLSLSITSFEMERLNIVVSNPVYSQWLILRFSGFATEGNSTPYPEIFHMLFNRNTQNFTSLDELIPNLSTTTPLHWSDDGKKLIIETTNEGFSIIYFPNLDSNLDLVYVDSAVSDQIVVGWLGAGDLLLTKQRDPITGDTNFFIAEIRDQQWFSAPFFQLAGDQFSDEVSGAWHIASTEDEKDTLTCLFDDTLNTQLQAGVRGRVTFTDGTGTRLRSEPNTYSAQLQVMPEGTEFDILSGPICGSGYRWWQIELDDGTTGWAAEASTEEYFLESLVPIQITSPTPAITGTPPTTITPTPAPDN